MPPAPRTIHPSHLHNKSVDSSQSGQLQKDDDPQDSAAKELQPTSSSSPETNEIRDETFGWHGILTQLTRNAGTITTDEGEIIRFKAKDFCESAVADLRDVLFVGFTLGFVAKPSDRNPNEYIASVVEPLFGEQANKAFRNTVEEINIHSEEYNKDLEIKSYHTLIEAFTQTPEGTVPFSHINKYMARQDEQIRKYIGKTAYELKNFLKSRFHIFFCPDRSDWIKLHHPRMYDIVVHLSAWLLRNGGCTAYHDLFHQFVKLMHPGTPPQLAKMHVDDFRHCMEGNKSAFNIFGMFVSVRGSFPLNFNYLAHVGMFFPECMELIVLEKKKQQKMEELAQLEKARQEKLKNFVEWRPRYVVASGNPELAGNSESSEVSEAARKAAKQWMETLGPETVVPEFGTYPELTDEETLDAVFAELQVQGRVPKFQVKYSNQDFDEKK